MKQANRLTQRYRHETEVLKDLVDADVDHHLGFRFFGDDKCLSGQGFALIADAKGALLSNAQINILLPKLFARLGIKEDRFPCPETIRQVACACSVLGDDQVATLLLQVARGELGGPRHVATWYDGKKFGVWSESVVIFYHPGFPGVGCHRRCCRRNGAVLTSWASVDY